MSDLPKYLRERADDTVSRLRAAVEDYKNVCYANSLGSEAMVLTDLIATAAPQIEIFTVDTGRLYPETYDLIERLQTRYNRSLKVYYPESRDVEGWVEQNGINGFRHGTDERHGCCGIRKIEPFRRAVAGRGAWVTGIRRGQSASRSLAAPVEWDADYGLHKISPLLEWSKTTFGPTSEKNDCLTIPCMIAGFRASAAHPALARFSRAKTRVPAAGGGSARSRANVDSTLGVRTRSRRSSWRQSLSLQSDP